MAFIHTGPCACTHAGCDRSWSRDPVLEVARPDCGAGIGVRCRRPSGHSGPFVELHVARDLLADRVAAYGPCPLGRCGASRAAPAEHFALFSDLVAPSDPARSRSPARS